MHRTRPRIRCAGLVLGTCVGLSAGCSGAPTFPKERLAESVQHLLAEEGLEASIKSLDHTLAVQVAYPQALQQTDEGLTTGPGLNDAARKVVTVLHRVLLSTDADIQFYVMLLSDPEIPGASLTMVRYLDDFKKYNVNRLGSDEFFARTVSELNLHRTPLSIDRYVQQDIRLDEFLSWQLSRRLQATLTQELPSGLVQVGPCGGEFLNGVFAFTLNVVPTQEGELDQATMQRMFHASTGLIAEVLSGYEFDDFSAIQLTHPPSGRNLILPKAHLDVFR